MTETLFSLFRDQQAAQRLAEYVREEEAVFLTLNFGMEIVQPEVQ